MRKCFIALALMVCAFSTAPALGQALETVVVTGYRGDSGSVPYVTLVRRADHLITTIRVTCDTRDSKARNAELKETLRNLIREATRSNTISLSVGEGVLRPFDENVIDKVIGPDSRPDTSKAVLVVKTAITKDDTFDSATKRIVDFLDRTPKAGRTEILDAETWQLTLVGPQQYHQSVVAKVAEDAKQTSALFGPEYGVLVEGLQNPVAWYQVDQLNLALYISYQMTIQLKSH